jgi:hypothetical protein
MKRVIFVALLAFLASPFGSGYPIARAGFAGNGDVNGDSSLDLSDAIYLLAFLFQGGPELEPCPGAGGGARVTPAVAVGAGGGPAANPELPATGQALCWDEDGNIGNCADSCPGQDGDPEVQAGCPMEGRFVLLPGPNGTEDPIEDPEDPVVDDTVFDRCTGLQWQRGTADIGREGDPDNPDGVIDDFDRLTWSEALNYCEVTLNNDGYGGHTDWRLPNAMELQSIVDYSRVDDADTSRGTLIDEAFTLGKYFVAANKRSFHWTSTCRPTCITTDPRPSLVFCRENTFPDSDPDILCAVYVEFATGGAGQSPLRRFDTGTQTFEEDTLYLVRAVRGGTTINAGAAGGVAARQQGQGAGISGNGDVNGDLATDLSDAIYLLAFLFQGGSMPEPCPPAGSQEVCNNGTDDDLDGDTDCADSDCTGDSSCMEVCNNTTDDDLDGATDCDDPDCLFDPNCPQPDPSPLPTTGVTLCYDDSGGEIPCAGSGQDGFYQAGCALTGAARFVLNVGPDMVDDTMDDTTIDDTITDLCTGLEWQRQRHDPDPVTPGTQILPWCEAVEYCKVTLNTDEFAGKTGWRFPNVREVHSLVLYGNTDPLPVLPYPKNNLIDPIFTGHHINGVQGECSSTVQGTFPLPGGVRRGYCVNFDRPGSISSSGPPPPGEGGLNFVSSIRAVRTADPP